MTGLSEAEINEQWFPPTAGKVEAQVRDGGGGWGEKGAQKQVKKNLISGVCIRGPGILKMREDGTKNRTVLNLEK